jgi:nitroimidazol reductase NimA-like FMN-containing flavoprotein (pyridoxamine 5'-phosphate oxidase superfamily)
VTVHRHPERANYDESAIRAVLDEGVLAHVGFQAPAGVTVIPMVYAPCPGGLYLHGSPGAGILRAVRAVPACVTVTLFDGLVVARSGFKHSVNYRSVVAFGEARRLQGDEKLAAVDAVVDHLVPGRVAEVRRPTPEELNQTAAVYFRIDEASLKVRSGGPLDHAEDMDPAVWAGWVPTPVRMGPPVPSAEVGAGVSPPPSVAALLARHGAPPAADGHPR